MRPKVDFAKALRYLCEHAKLIIAAYCSMQSSFAADSDGMQSADPTVAVSGAGSHESNEAKLRLSEEAH